ncbi:carboxymuconolactone decarboxylase family protein [Candidatus Neomicrothrix sp.]|jgi:4-carboxymuconolactone decarboxylase|uniref:Carboxymuconolactone decarboxylase family protein n=1 Tax=Candidatus Neomicrothrix subdominans TaxID=2954438 RepID=A0A936NCZ3_9ACTN|nr:carboxymuconolactone decarboxylase family protein [Candidatus Microthrix sp.]MBK9298052.1 carboxymuconolactone decarboxylase family protein [Candidatus Microthrix subdominans]MBK6309562.1 carboxymuconolactone decarboxylase family protein [Candidatus Microthrix sp.]MBK6439125.1 carboxymuconolactone decarboxylase family protein [Candidatus Microthrix sp.]MBK6967890.1 carboxymuconolactone decarboxylase family protein [Candidatus Microthrix sp.]MBP7594868.1 carboxymuconolactone decarboxylase fa
MSDDGQANADDRRQRGLAMMKDVYGWDIPHVEGAFVESTVDHLFADVWTEGTMTIKERRLMLIGMAVAGGMEDVASLQLDAAVRLGELDAEDLRSIVVFVAHYAGWPRGAKLNTEVEKIIAKMDDA